MIASPLLAGCVTSGAYEAALADAQAARIAAVRCEAETRALRAEVDSLSRRLDAQAPAEGEVRSALELEWSLRALGLIEGRAADRGRRAAPPQRGAGTEIAATHPLDADDPWVSARASVVRPAATPPLDATDPW